MEYSVFLSLNDIILHVHKHVPFGFGLNCNCANNFRFFCPIIIQAVKVSPGGSLRAQALEGHEEDV